MYNGMLKELSADFSVETLQARNEWHDILKMLTGKKLTTKNILPGKITIPTGRTNKEFPRWAKAKGVHQHQTAFTRNLKETF